MKKISSTFKNNQEFILRPFALVNHEHTQYITADDINGSYGSIQVLDSTARDAIAVADRYEGLFVYVTGTQTNFQLQGGILNTDWVEVAGAGGTGVTRAELADNNETIDMNAGFF